jgi:hypothetical protein
MGGFGSGGHRPGSGRKRKSKRERALAGNAGHRGRVLPHPSAPPAPPPPPTPPEIDEADAPNDLTIEERHLWMELAPHATANGTLTPATSLSFRLLCKNIALLLRYYPSVTEASNANHRGLMQRVDAELLRFCLSPIGKAIIEDEKPQVDPMEAKYGS